MPNSFSTMALTSLFLLLLLSSLHVVTTVARATPEFDSHASEANSISPKAYLVHYWDKQITNNLPKPPVLFSKASPLTAAFAAIFTQLVAKGAISDHLLSFCEEAKLFCFWSSSFSGVKIVDNQNYGNHVVPTFIDNQNYGDRDNQNYGDRDNQNYGDHMVRTFVDNQNYGDRDNQNYGDRDNQNYGDHMVPTFVDNQNYGNRDNQNYGDRVVSAFVYSRDNQNYGDHVVPTFIDNQNYGDRDNQNYGNHVVPTFIDNQNYGGNVATKVKADDKNVNRGMEPSMFFRESMLKSGNVMSMPDLRDNMPKMSFLPRSISSKLPFSTSKLAELKQIFHSVENSTMEKMALALGRCEVAPIRGETKMCVASIEDMIDFATSILGHDVMVRSTEGTGGSKQEVLIGLVNRIEGTEVSKPVACHHTLFPYMVYFCHSFENVRVYEVDILDRKSKAKINHGVAICHMDTSAWRPTHEAFLTLGSGPGQIEVCHWIYENGMLWTRGSLISDVYNI